MLLILVSSLLSMWWENAPLHIFIIPWGNYFVNYFVYILYIEPTNGISGPLPPLARALHVENPPEDAPQRGLTSMAGRGLMYNMEQGRLPVETRKRNLNKAINMIIQIISVLLVMVRYGE